MGGAHLQCVNNHSAKFEYKGMKTVRVTDYTNKASLSISDRIECVSSTPFKNMSIKCVQNERCISPMWEQSLCKV